MARDRLMDRDRLVNDLTDIDKRIKKLLEI